MKHRTEIIRHIAMLNNEDIPATTQLIRRRTLLRPDQISNVLVEIEAAELLEREGSNIWLNEAGWEEYKKGIPQPVDPSLLLSHSNGKSD